MKIQKNVFKGLLIAAIMIFSAKLSAQKIEFETLEINYGDIVKGANGVREFKFNQSTGVAITSTIKIKNEKNSDYYGKITFSGADSKGNKYSAAYDFTFKTGETNYKGEISIKSSKENPVFISEVTMAVSNDKKEIASATEPIISKSKKTSFAILLNGIKSSEYCNEVEIQKVFMNESYSAKYFAVVLGLNNTKKEPSAPEIAMSSGQGSSTGVFIWMQGADKKTISKVKPIVDKNGNWFYTDSIAIGKDTPVLAGFQIEYVTACGDTFYYSSAFKVDANKKTNKAAIVMHNRLIYGEIGGISQTYLTWNPKLAGLDLGSSSTIAINGGSVEIRDNATFTMGTGGTSINNGNLKPSNINDVFIVLNVAPLYKTENVKRYTYRAEWNKDKGRYEAKAGFDASKENPYVILSSEIRLVDENKDTMLMESNGKFGSPMFGISTIMIMTRSGKLKYKDPCDTKFKLKELEYSESTVSGLYTMKFSYQLEAKSDVPSDMAMIVEITDCNGNKDYIRITLKYDAKSNTYTGSEAIKQNKECLWTLTYGEIAAYNPCKDKTVWSFKTSESKSNGSGTRNVATTTSGNPGLL